MVKGFQSFARWFQGYEKEYAIIGGTACDLLMSAEGLAFLEQKLSAIGYTIDYGRGDYVE